MTCMERLLSVRSAQTVRCPWDRFHFWTVCILATRLLMLVHLPEIRGLFAGGSTQAAMTVFGDFFGTCDPHEASRSKPHTLHILQGHSTWCEALCTQ